MALCLSNLFDMPYFYPIAASLTDHLRRPDAGRHPSLDGVYRRGQSEGVVPASVPHPLLPPLLALHGGPPLLQSTGQPVGAAVQ